MHVPITVKILQSFTEGTKEGKKKTYKKVHGITSGFPLTTSCMHGHWIATRKFSTPYMVWSMETFRSKMSGMYMYIRLRTDNTVYVGTLAAWGLKDKKKKHNLRFRWQWREDFEQKLSSWTGRMNVKVCTIWTPRWRLTASRSVLPHCLAYFGVSPERRLMVPIQESLVNCQQTSSVR